MTEFKKMINSKLYQANLDKNLLEFRIKAKDLCFEFNNTKPSDRKKQREIIKKLQIKTKGDFTIEAPFYCDYGKNIEIGENFFANHYLTILDCNKVKIGDNVFIGPSCTLATAGHPIDKKRRNQGLEYAYPIEIGNNVWLGANVTINPGVKIGDNCVIGSGSLVTKSIEKNSLAYGNPCKVIRKINKKDQKTNFDK